MSMRAGRMVRYALLIAIGGVVMLPLAWAVLASLKPLAEVYRLPPIWWVDSPAWSNYVAALNVLPLLRFLWNSSVISLTSVAGAVLTSSMAGYAFARLDWPGKRIWFVLLLASLVVPSQVLLMPRFFIYEWLGWVGSYKPLIVPAWLGGGAFNVLLFRQFFMTIPREMQEAATVDGATGWQTYWQIMLPAAKPAVLAVVLMSLIIHWQEFMTPLIYLSDFQTYPVALGLRMYQSMAGTWGNLLMAASLVALVPVVAVVIVLQRYIGAAGRFNAANKA